MPGVVKMENGALNGARTDHDRSHGLNGASNGLVGGEPASSKAQPSEPIKSSTMVNGGEVQNPVGGAGENSTSAKRYRMNDLPDEIAHITEGFIPLSKLLSRLSQHTHNALQEKIVQLARMPVPPSAGPAVNGNAASTARGGDEYDNSPESLQKKVSFLNFLQTHRGKWIKALVIANWSRAGSDISKLIDLKGHLNRQMLQFDARLDQLIDLKRDLTFARIPSPDLKTGYQVLSAGTGEWMPDMQYIEPPPLTKQAHDKWLEEQNIALSTRLNIVDFDKIPRHFRDYSIDEGRATFRVKGEFEVDLTIADEDAEKQFWFIDFRFAFTPGAGDVSERMKAFLEQHVNNALGRDGLSGCYTLLHEYVLTHKIGELRRQAIELARSSWAGTISVENLDRSFSIQYWTTRQSQSARLQRPGKALPPSAPKSWVIVGVRGTKRPDGLPDAGATTTLMAKWYRDGKEVKDAMVEFDHDTLSTERLLKGVIAKHVAHILTAIHDRLRSAPRFANLEAAMSLDLCATEPGDSCLTMQLSSSESVRLRIEPTTGQFTIHPHSKFSLQGETRLNYSGKDPSEDGAQCLENIRWYHVAEEVTRKGRAVGWMHVKSPLSVDETRTLFKPRESFHPVCLQRQGIEPSWYVMLIMSLQGDEWWAFQAPGKKPSLSSVKTYMKLPLLMGHPDLRPEFWNNLTTFLTAVIAHTVDLRELHKNKVRYDRRLSQNMSLPSQVGIPSIFIKLSDILPTAVEQPSGTPPGSEKNDSPESGDGAANNKSTAEPPPPPAPTPTPTPRQQAGSGSGSGSGVGTGTGTGSGGQARPTAQTMAPQRRPWAQDFVEVKYRNASWPTNDGDRGRLCYNADALVRVLDRSKFSKLKSKVGRDVLYNATRAQFCIRLQAYVGTSMFETLATRLQSIDRVVDCIDAMGTARHAIKCESVTLQKVVFTYGDGHPPPEGDAPPAKRWQATLDLSGPQITIALDRGNPHNRILDILTCLVNTPGGIRALTSVLPDTLNMLTSLDRISAAWREASKQGRGTLVVTHKRADWFTLCYNLPENASRPRSLRIDVRAGIRDGKTYWLARRADTPPDGAQDFFSQKLRKVWEARSLGWRGFGNGAAMGGDEKNVRMLAALDQVVRESVLGDASQAAGQAKGVQQHTPKVTPVPIPKMTPVPVPKGPAQHGPKGMAGQGFRK